MNILLVEDLISKANKVAEAVCSICGEKTVITRASSVASGLKALSKTQFDLLLLDLVLPLRDGGKPQKASGTELLGEIVDGTSARKPTHIICLTQYPDQADVLDTRIQLGLAHIVKYDERSAEWRDALEAKCRYILGRLKEADTYPADFLADVAVLTSAPVVELTEVLRLDPLFVCEFNSQDVLHYHLTKWRSAAGNDLRVVACAAPQMGMTAACVTASKVIERWRPRLLAICGIAAGTKGDLHFGDVLIGEMVFDYGSGKISDTKSGKRVFVPDPRPLTIDVELKAILQSIERTQAGVGDFMKEWRGQQIDRVPQLRLGVLASGAAVVQSDDLVREILRTSRKTVGLEMEAYGFFHAAALARQPRPRVLVAKSVLDFADHHKTDKWQLLAAFTSARFVYSLRQLARTWLGKVH